MNRMIGVLLMICGVISCVVGFMMYSKPGDKETTNYAARVSENKTSKSKEVREAVMEKAQVANVADPTSLRETQKESEVDGKVKLLQVIEVAIADGVLTNNEKALIKKISLENGLDHDLMLKDAESELAARGIRSETEVIDQNKKAGDDFEKFMVKKFDRRYFELLEWTGDKYVDGQFSKTNYQPDLLLKLKSGNYDERFSIECKWRGRFSKEISIASEGQLARYKQYQEKMNIPVFIAIGIGGTASNPKELFIVPLKDIHTNVIAMAVLNRYGKDIEKGLRFDQERKRIY